MMSTMDPLFAELQSLARRYGVEKVDATWKRTKDKINADSKRLSQKTFDRHRMSLEIKDGDCGEAFASLFSVNFGPKSLMPRAEWDLTFRGSPPTKLVFNSIIKSLIFSQRQKMEHSVASAFHTLSLPCGEPLGKKYLTLIKNGMECVNIFQNVIMVGRPSIERELTSLDNPMIDHELLYYIKESTAQGNYLKSLTLRSIIISASAAMLLQSMIESDRLAALRLEGVVISTEERSFASKIVIRGLRGLTMDSHPNSGMLNLRKLSISQGLVDDLLPIQAKALFRAISSIESLREFSMCSTKRATLERLTELNFKSLKRLNFFYSEGHSQTYPDFTNLIELVDRSKELVFFHPFITTLGVPVHWSYTEQLMNLALRSGGSRLLEIETAENFFHTHDLSDLTLPESPTLQDVQLRKFTLFSHDSGVETMFEDRDHDGLVCDLTTLLDLLRNRLCYLFDIGLGYRPEGYIFSLLEHDAEASAIFQQIMVQLERNRVGTRLLTLRPRVPRGLWPLVLEQAADNRCSRFCEPDCISKAVPWTAIYEVVQTLVSTGQLGEEDSLIFQGDRRKRHRISKTSE